MDWGTDCILTVQCLYEYSLYNTKKKATVLVLFTFIYALFFIIKKTLNGVRQEGEGKRKKQWIVCMLEIRVW